MLMVIRMLVCGLDALMVCSEEPKLVYLQADVHVMQTPYFAGHCSGHTMNCCCT